ncbi:putative Histidine kinase [Candidatus Terasakiella magnetica]|uniref:histidine kinase n=1 Tax=Candidatus Terasakiella magnetica TaxID=1867952 RepID=A0A1C3RED8_9PROT|nr:HAMP domain-containing sensor histidine kinase [Candidatus Terasakiella magnetica]SCA55660.1 putative Histidine kinase [Candidatus Terasakiella magnetica]
MSEKESVGLDHWFETSLDLLCILNDQMGFEKASASWSHSLGWPLGELTSLTVLELLHCDDIKSVEKALSNCLKTGEAAHFECRCKNRDEQYIWFSWSVTRQGKQLYGNGHNIDAKKQSEIHTLYKLNLLEMAEQTARVGHWHLDTASGLFDWSQEVFNIFGRRPNKTEITLDDFIDAFSGSHQKQLWTLIQQALNDASEINTELVIKREDTQRRSVIVRAVCERDANQVIKGMFGIIQDVTEERLHQKSLRNKEELLSMAFRATSDGIWDWDLVSDQVWFSPQWKAQLGYADDEIVNRFDSWANLVFEEDRLKAMNELDAHCQGKTDRFEMIQRFRHKKGHTVFILVRAYALRDEEGRAIRMIGAHTDITEIKKLEQAKSEFTSIVSHELRTPITAVRGAIGLLNSHYNSELSDQVKKLVELANNNCERLTLLVNDILDMDKLQSGRMDLDIQPIQINSFLNTVIDNHRTYGDQFGVSLHCDTNGEDLQVLADQDRLMQVMANLVSNAIKFSDEKDTVKVRAYLRNKKVAISVIDTGRGIPREMRDKIFDKFTQADSSDQRHKGGTGLGLTISKAMVENMNGTINVISKEGEGSTFSITLPSA